MKRYLLLEAHEENWNFKDSETWESVSWQVYSDGSYTVRIGYLGEAFVEKSGKMRKDSFSALCDAMDQEWTSELTAAGVDGKAWKIKQFLPDGSVCKTSGKLGYIYGQETLERIASLLPGKSFVLEHESKPTESEMREVNKMTNRTKVIGRRETDGYSVGRFYGRKTDNSLALELRLEATLIPFAMDLEHRSFLIFMIKRQRDLNVFLWVSLDDERNKEKIRMTAVNDLMQYTKWSGEPMDCSGNYPEEVIAKALAILDNCSLSELRDAYDSMTEKMNEIGGYEYWRKDEKGILDTVKEAKLHNQGIVYMY